MCIATYGKVMNVKEGLAVIDCNGTKREAIAKGLAIKKGDYVLVQFGVIIQKIAPEDIILQNSQHQ